MLVITRQTDEGFWIGNDIHVRVLRIKGRSVRIGIETGSELRILRDEIKSEDGRVTFISMDKVEQ